MPRPPPRSTLFPYTTLFRSIAQGRLRSPIHDHYELRISSRTPTTACIRKANNIDRKSTRLNSSHVEISYAVFCLKKKNQGDAVQAHRTERIGDAGHRATLSH